MGSYSNMAKYNYVNKTVLFGGGNGATNTIFRMDADGKITKLNSTPCEVRNASSVQSVDPVSGDYLFLSRGSVFYALDAIADKWTQLNASAVPMFQVSASSPEGIAFGIIATPMRNYGITFYASYHNNNPKVFIYKHTQSTAIQKLPLQKSSPLSLEAFPNPLKSGQQLQLKLAGNISERVEILNLRGRLVFSAPSAKVIRPSLSPGIYTLRLNFPGRTLSKKIVVLN